MIQNAGLRISEALAGKVRDVRLANGIAKSVGVIGKGNKARLVPFPQAFGQVFGYWSANMRRGDFVLAKAPGEKLPGPRASRVYLNRLIEKARIDKQATPHKLWHTEATRILESGAERVDIQALPGQVNLSTTQIYTHVGEDRMDGEYGSEIVGEGTTRRRWIHPGQLRYYQADLVRDLFGEWTLVRIWGGLDTARGSYSSTGVASHEEGIHQLEVLDSLRRQHGYLPVDSLADLPTPPKRETPAPSPSHRRRKNPAQRELDLGT